MSEKPSVNLFKKLLEVRKSIKSVKKTGYNSYGGYHYPTEQDLMEAVRDSLNEQGVLVFTSSKITDMRPSTKMVKGKEEPSGFITSVETEHTFVDAETGESFSVTSVGQGHDALGDKGSNKGVTSSIKYLISKNFLIETNDDPEADGGKKTYNKKPYTNKPKSSSSSGFGTKSASKSSGFGTTTSESTSSFGATPDNESPSGFGGQTKTSSAVDDVEF